MAARRSNRNSGTLTARQSLRVCAGLSVAASHCAAFYYFCLWGAAGKFGRSAVHRESPLREDVYLYGVQRRVEEFVWQLFRRCRPSAHIVVLRLASVSGPRGRFGLNRYGLLSTIAGGFPFLICGRPDWGRQYLHEDDLIDVVSMLVHLPPTAGYQVFNVSPPDFLDVTSIGRLFNKRVVALRRWHCGLCSLSCGMAPRVRSPHRLERGSSSPIRSGSTARSYSGPTATNIATALLKPCRRAKAVTRSRRGPACMLLWMIA